MGHDEFVPENRAIAPIASREEAKRVLAGIKERRERGDDGLIFSLDHARLWLWLRTHGLDLEEIATMALGKDGDE